MAVLVEGISVVIKREALEDRFPGGLDEFVRSVPNSTLCMDEHLVRVGFMSPVDVADYVGHLEACGMVYLDRDAAVDMVVADQQRGLAAACDWARIVRVDVAEGQSVAACVMTSGGAAGLNLALPEGWRFDESLSKKFHFFTTEEVAETLDRIDAEGQVHEYRDRRTGETVFLGSTTSPEKQREFEDIEAVVKRALELDEQGNRARKHNDQKSGEAVYEELTAELLPKVEGLTMRSQYHPGFAHFAYGLVLRVLLRREEAEAQFRKSLSFRPGLINTLLELTRCLGEMERPAEAEPYAREAVEVSPDSAAAWGNLAAVLIALKDREGARAALDKALLIDPADTINRQIADGFETCFGGE